MTDQTTEEEVSELAQELQGRAEDRGKHLKWETARALAKRELANRR